MTMSVRTRDWLKFGTLVVIAFVFGLAFASALNLPKQSGASEAGRFRAEANANPNTKAMTTRVPNFSQSRVRTDIVISLVVKGIPLGIYTFLLFSSSTIS